MKPRRFMPTLANFSHLILRRPPPYPPPHAGEGREGDVSKDGRESIIAAMVRDGAPQARLLTMRA
jgi:hypothetical protein